MRARIKVVCFFYNEAALLPFFLSHYRFVDTIHAIVSKSTDDTREVLANEECRMKNVESRRKMIIEEWEMPGGLDDFMKRDKVNQVINRPDPNHDWLFVLDADEFIWAPGWVECADRDRFDLDYMPGFLSAVPHTVNCLVARMWNVYRHAEDFHLDPHTEPVVLQRRHGVPERSMGENALYQKPIVIRPDQGLTFDIGNHFINGPARRSASGNFDGAHWANADPSFAVNRRCRDRRARLSETNLKNGLGSQHFGVTEEIVREQCRAHEQDPQVF